VTSLFEQRVAALGARGDSALAGGLKGIEKESLRVDADGYLARSSHPLALGSALTNKYITTDFSEALLEFVTPACATTWEALQALLDIHQFTFANLEDELLWVASMPCRIPGDLDIPLARYGNSNVGQMKTIYRRGLGYRYGRPMQTIAGVHFNYSLPESFWPGYAQILGEARDSDEFRSEQYMALVRNFRRMGWMLLYLYGASPALCKSFGDKLKMQSFNDETWFEPFATSLRMSDLGYSNQTQSSINISLNTLDEYIRDLSAAIRTPDPAYEEIGVKVDGKYRQLNANKLQIENEYYSPVRPKRVAHSGERPTSALRRGGVEYVEIRALDLNVFDPCGISQNTMRFIEAFLVYCLLEKSDPLDDAGLEEVRNNQDLTARRGRDPDLVLQRDGAAISLRDWGEEIVDRVAVVAELIDRGESSDSYRAAVQAMQDLLADTESTPSARVLDELRTRGVSFFSFALEMARNHREYFSALAPLPERRATILETEASNSLERQRAIEAADEISFDQYLEQYFANQD
jgi:glutamate--cysteine ligase